jgi:hypothetical protein
MRTEGSHPVARCKDFTTCDKNDVSISKQVQVVSRVQREFHRLDRSLAQVTSLKQGLKTKF